MVYKGHYLNPSDMHMYIYQASLGTFYKSLSSVYSFFFPISEEGRIQSLERQQNDELLLDFSKNKQYIERPSFIVKMIIRGPNSWSAVRII